MAQQMTRVVGINARYIAACRLTADSPLATSSRGRCALAPEIPQSKLLPMGTSNYCAALRYAAIASISPSSSVRTRSDMPGELAREPLRNWRIVAAR